MRRTFLQIMREANAARRAGVSVPVALSAAVDDDADWQVIWDRLASSARLEQGLKRIERNRKQRRD